MTQYDVKLIKACEEYTKQRLTKTEIDEKEALSDITHLTKIMQVFTLSTVLLPYNCFNFFPDGLQAETVRKALAITTQLEVFSKLLKVLNAVLLKLTFDKGVILQ